MNYIASKRGKGRYKRSFRSGFYNDKYESRRNAKERKRLNPAPLPDEPPYVELKLPKLLFATVTIRCGKESISFRVHKWDEKRLLCLGKIQAASSIGRRVALCLDAALSS
jgi:hypothetical protein